MIVNKSPNTLMDEHAQSLAAALKYLNGQDRLDLEGMLPARVVNYDPVKNVADVQVMIQVTRLDPKGGDVQRIERPNLVNIPCLSLGAGGFHIHFPIKPNDLGWIFAGDRDISLYIQNLTNTHAATNGASHKFKDGFFIPDVLRKYTLNEEDVDRLVIQTTDGSTRISITDSGEIKITAPETAIINTSKLLVNASDSVTINTPKYLVDAPQSEFTGKVTSKGMTSTGGMDTVGSLKVDGKEVNNHDHGGVVSGGSKTDPF